MTQQSLGLQHYTTPPTFRVALADRPGLLELLRSGNDRRLILLEAPAGYGKTWLLARWYAELRRSGERVVWLGADKMDSAQLLALMVAGFERSGIDVGRLEGLAAQGFADVPLRAVVNALTATLESVPATTAIFLDDLHRLGRDAVQDVLARLVVEAPPSVRFVFGGRDLSALPHAEFRARGELLEIGAAQLRFGRDEASVLLPSLAGAQLERLLERTEGWPVALQLARLWLEADPERSSLLDGFSGRTSEVAEYLTEQVLADLAPDLQKTLSEVAILDALNPSLVADVTGSQDAWRRLLDEGRLEHFLVPLDAERFWFRLHHLLLDYLRARHREDAADLPGLHGRASASFERNGDLLEAVRHAVLADDVPRAARLIERAGGWEMVLFGGTVRMRALLSLLPKDRIAEFPRIQLFQAFLAAKDGEPARALRLFEAATAAGAAAQDPAVARDQLVVGHLIGRYADTPVGPDDLAAAYGQAESLPPSDDAARAAVLNTACLVAFAIGDMPATLEACHRAIREMRRIGSVLGLNYCLLHLGLAQLHRGERREAEATWREAAAMAEENFGADSGLKSIADVHLAVALHARGDVAAAAARLEEALGHVESTDGWLDLYAEGYAVAIANALARGNATRAADLIARMKRTAESRGLARLDHLADAFRARFDLQTNPGQGSGAAAALHWQAGEWRTRPSSWREHHAAGQALALAAFTDDRPDAALAILDDLAQSAEGAGRIRQARTIAVLRAAALHRRGEEAAVLMGLATALDAAAREDDTQFLVDLGPVLLPVLQRAWSWSREQGSGASVRQVLASAVTTLVRASETQDAPAVLSARELEVLVELAAGAPNKVIARNLQMTENTVKFHLKNMFQKLKVRHRTQALQAAQARGLLR